jgi:uncharacterized protein YjiS (DUF1127 family)
MSALSQQVAPDLALHVSPVAAPREGGLRRIWKRFQEDRRYRATVRELRRMPAPLRADLGIARGQVRDVARAMVDGAIR